MQFLSHRFLLYQYYFNNGTVFSTVEPRLIATSLIRSPRYYGHFFSAWQHGHTFSYEKTLLMRSPVNMANSHILKFQAVESLKILPR